MNIKNRQAQGYSRFFKPSYGWIFDFGNSQALKIYKSYKLDARSFNEERKIQTIWQ
jgi:hypothetical protein